ncbi:MAG: CD3337/EF1877 family mobilome membrane protein, partial [Butyricicoccus sp.]
MTHKKVNTALFKKTAVTGTCILVIAVFLFLVFCPSAGAVGLVDDTVDAAHEYSRYPLENYQLDFYVDNRWDWLPWNWIDGIGKQVMYGLYCITNFIWTINLYLSNASGYLVQEAYGLDFISDAADEIGRNIQSIAGISPSGLSADGFYAGFLLLIILIVGTYVAYTGLIKRETTKAVRAVMNMVLIFVLSGALIAYAPDCVKRLNEFSEDVSTASLSVGTKIVLPDVESSGADSVDLIRDSLFSIQVKQPWLLLQFGDTDTDAIGADRVESLLSASPGGNNGEDRENAVKAEIEDNGNTNLTVTKTVNRLGTVFFLFLFNLGISVFVFLLTGMMIFSQVLFIIYAMFLPVSFVLSMVPTFEGSSRRAVIKLFNTILARAGITLVITVAFSISTMLYRISSGYPFFIIAFLQVVVFAGIYFKLGDLLSMFSLHDDGARGMGRYILHRPRMFLHHQLHRLNRTMRAATASRPNDGGSTQNSRSSSTAGTADSGYRYRSNRPDGGSSGASQAGAVHGLPEVPVRGLPSGGSGSGTGAPPQGGNPPSHDGMY